MLAALSNNYKTDRQFTKIIIPSTTVITLVLIGQVLHNASQEAVYTRCGRELITRVLDGYNGTILAYGQTGAGKTHTMTGPSSNFTLRGIVPRAIAQVHTYPCTKLVNYMHKLVNYNTVHMHVKAMKGYKVTMK